MSRKVILAIGSNDEGEQRLQQALATLGKMMEGTRSSSILQTEPIGDFPDPFHNCLVTGYTSESVEELTAHLKRIERRYGDRKTLRRQGRILMDIDLLEYDGTRYHDKDWERTYIQQLMKELSEAKNDK